MRNKIALILAVVFLAGLAIVVYSGRPSGQPSAPASGSESNPAPTGTYSLSDVTAHATSEDCWAAIGGSVYDLTSWISRHPGGAQAITNLCGTDGTTAFERKHGGSRPAQAALVLLKIGNLK